MSDIYFCSLSSIFVRSSASLSSIFCFIIGSDFSSDSGSSSSFFVLVLFVVRHVLFWFVFVVRFPVFRGSSSSCFGYLVSVQVYMGSAVTTPFFYWFIVLSS